MCNRDDGLAVVDLDGVPVHCNIAWEDAAAARRAPRGDLRLRFCVGCGMIHNAAFDPERVDYAPHYENAQHFSPRFRVYLEGLVESLLRRFELRGRDLVELGCGDGHFLARLCDRGLNRGRGFDPAAPVGSPSSRVELRREFFDARSPVPFDFVTFRHVLEHDGRPREFLAALRHACGDRSVGVYCEVPDARFSLVEGGVWDLLYEHYAYFTDTSLRRLFADSGFEVEAVESRFDGQFLGLEARSGRAVQTVSPPAEELCSAVEDFTEAYRRRLSRWQQELERWRRDGLRGALWGAGTKGVMFLNSVPGADAIEQVVDLSPRKRGRCVAGTGQSIVGPDDLEDDLDVVVVMNPAYTEEIRADLRHRGLDPEVVVA